MTRPMILPLLFGLIGAAFLFGLGHWQMQRLEWKEAVLAAIDARIAEAPVALPAAPDPKADGFLPVTATGRLTGEGLRVLVSRKPEGAGHRYVAVLETDDGRRILVDRGFRPEAGRDAPLTAGPVEVAGNLHWPGEVDGYTPAPDRATGLWFARDVPAMAEALGTEPVFLIARSPTGDGIDPMPVTRDGIPNNHWQYAVTWYLLAIGWLGMTALLLWRIRQRNE